MKTRTLLITTVLLSVVTVIITGGAKREIHVDEVIKALSHTWVNTDYYPEMMPQKLVVSLDGLIKYYREADTPLDTPALSSKYTINEAWTDREGNIWFKATSVSMEGTSYSLDRISNSGTVWESVYSYGELPDDIDVNSPKYRIFYRQ